MSVTNYTKYDSNLGSLNPNTTYTYRAFVTDNRGTVYGNTLSFTTPPQLYTVYFNFIDDYKNQYFVTSSPIIVQITDGIYTGSGSANGGAFTVTMENVPDNGLEYTYNAIANTSGYQQNIPGTFNIATNGTNIDIRILPAQSVITSSGFVEIYDPYSNTPTSFDLSDVQVDGATPDGCGMDAIEVGVVYGLNSVDYTYVVSNSYSYPNINGTLQHIGLPTGTLIPQTNYYYMPYIKNYKDECQYGQQNVFTTIAELPVLPDLSTNNVINGMVNLNNFTIGYEAYHLITEMGVVYGQSPDVDVNSGTKCDGAITSVPVQQSIELSTSAPTINPGTYYFKAYAIGRVTTYGNALEVVVPE